MESVKVTDLPYVYITNVTHRKADMLKVAETEDVETMKFSKGTMETKDGKRIFFLTPQEWAWWCRGRHYKYYGNERVIYKSGCILDEFE